ncbi:hypothetical protein C8J56DRAFT_900444 [Mycena floridula]|nr:hypothetical protein C8J56DRAFT_900444 [Mycena floridula]
MNIRQKLDLFTECWPGGRGHIFAGGKMDRILSELQINNLPCGEKVTCLSWQKVKILAHQKVNIFAAQRFPIFPDGWYGKRAKSSAAQTFKIFPIAKNKKFLRSHQDENMNSNGTVYKLLVEAIILARESRVPTVRLSDAVNGSSLAINSPSPNPNPKLFLCLSPRIPPALRLRLPAPVDRAKSLLSESTDGDIEGTLDSLARMIASTESLYTVPFEFIFSS